MHESIYRFLLESGYPRASIITDPEALTPEEGITGEFASSPAFAPGSPVDIASGEPGNSAASRQIDNVDSHDPESPAVQAYQPAVVIVDPDTCDRLAVIDVVESDSAEEVVAGGLKALAYAAGFSDQYIQSYIMQININNPDREKQIRFYKLSRQNKILPLPTYAFPDLDTLRVARKMEIGAAASRFGMFGRRKSDQERMASSRGSSSKRTPTLLYILSLLLIGGGIIDWSLMNSRGYGVFTTNQILLFVAAVFLLALPLLLRQLRR